MFRLLLNECDTTIPGEIFLNSQGSNTAPPRPSADYEEVIVQFCEAKDEAVAAGQVSYSHIPVEHRTPANDVLIRVFSVSSPNRIKHFTALVLKQRLL